MPMVTFSGAITEPEFVFIVKKVFDVFHGRLSLSILDLQRPVSTEKRIIIQFTAAGRLGYETASDPQFLAIAATAAAARRWSAKGPPDQPGR